jgi:hypothetical protein
VSSSPVDLRVCGTWHFRGPCVCRRAASSALSPVPMLSHGRARQLPDRAVLRHRRRAGRHPRRSPRQDLAEPGLRGELDRGRATSLRRPLVCPVPSRARTPRRPARARAAGKNGTVHGRRPEAKQGPASTSRRSSPRLPRSETRSRPKRCRKARRDVACTGNGALLRGKGIGKHSHDLVAATGKNCRLPVVLASIWSLAYRRGGR